MYHAFNPRFRGGKIKSIQDAIKAMHGCDSRYVESVPVHDVFQGPTAWEGIVEVLDLIGHSKARRVYAWQYEDGNKTKTLAVLEIPPVNSPLSALKLVIAPRHPNES